MNEKQKYEFIDEGTHLVLVTQLGRYLYSKCHRVPMVPRDGKTVCGQCQIEVVPGWLRSKPKLPSHGQARMDALAADGYQSESTEVPF